MLDAAVTALAFGGAIAYVLKMIPSDTWFWKVMDVGAAIGFVIAAIRVLPIIAGAP